MDTRFWKAACFERAAYHFEMELQLMQGKSPDAYTGFALVYALTSRWPEARECMDKAGKLNARYKDVEKLRLSLRWTRPQIEILRRDTSYKNS